jgi:hypothetical protein
MALCQACRDSRFRGMVVTKVTFTRFRGNGYLTSWSPCPECGGSGIEHCDGLREQPGTGAGRSADAAKSYTSESA